MDSSILISSFFETHFRIKTGDEIKRRFYFAEIIFKFKKVINIFLQI